MCEKVCVVDPMRRTGLVSSPANEPIEATKRLGCDYKGRRTPRAANQHIMIVMNNTDGANQSMENSINAAISN